MSVETNGDLALVLNLSRHSSFLPEDLSMPFSTSSDSPKGTGPYHIVKQTESEVVLERFEPYYLGTPIIPRIVVRPIETLRNAWPLLMKGDLDMVTDLPPDTVDLVRNDEIQVRSFSRPYQYLVAFNSKHPKFSNPVVRRALNMAIDRDAIVKDVLHGYGQASIGPIWPRHWAYDTSVEAFAFDAPEAIRLLKSARLDVRASADPAVPPARLRFTCIIPADFSMYERVGLEVQRQLLKVGVDMQFDVLPFDEYEARMRKGVFEAAFVDMVSGPSLRRPYLFWGSAQQGRGLNFYGYENPQVEELFQVLRASTTDQSVRTITHRLQTAFMKDPPAIFLAWNQRSRAIRTEFGVPEDRDSDPLLTLWRWGADNRSETLASR